MKYLVDTKNSIRRSLPLYMGVALFLYFSYHAVSGDRSFVRYTELQTTYQSQQLVLAALEKEVDSLGEKVSMMRPETLSADMAEEQIRYVLGYHEQNTYVVISD